jgi:hypothetical protein
MGKCWEEAGARQDGAVSRRLDPATPLPDPKNRMAPEVL